MKQQVRPVWVLWKAIFLFMAFNILYALLGPPIGKLSIYNHIVPGRVRFPYEQESSFYFVGYNAPIYEDFNAMFGAHIISARKRNDEFRLILLGDSATWGISVQASETLSEQINQLHIQTCDGRNIRAYNLGYPMPFLMRDALILDQAMDYEPDMIFWLVTLNTLEPKTAETYFILPHAKRYQRILSTYSLKSSRLAEPVKDPNFWRQTIVGERRRLKKIVVIQMLGFLWAATGIDNHEGLQPVTSPASIAVDSRLDYEGWQPEESALLFDSLRLDVLSAGTSMAGDVPVVLVNEPIFVAEGENHLIRYNPFYPRWAYDAYRNMMDGWATKERQAWLDYWNTLPGEGFSDQNFHRSAAGEQQFAKLLAPAIKKLVCTQ
jgi:hypothetical protein